MLTFWHHDSIRHVDVINGCVWMIQQKSLSQVGLLDEAFFMYGEDIDWCKRFGEAGFKIENGAAAPHAVRLGQFFQ